MEKVSLSDKLSQFSDHWNPRLVGELNGQHVKLVKFQGEFVWHHHEHEDELFLVVDGALPDGVSGIVRCGSTRGEFLIVPRGVEHRPVADEEVSVLLFEPAGTVNTGNVVEGRTRGETEADLTNPFEISAPVALLSRFAARPCESPPIFSLSSTENSPSLARTRLLGSLKRGSFLLSGPSECDRGLPDDRCRVRRCLHHERREADRYALCVGGQRRCVDDRERRRQRPACRLRQS